MRQVRNLPASQEDVDHLADLLDTIGADERAAEEEQKEVVALQSAADVAKGKAIDVLTDALDKMITADAREITSRLNHRQVSIGREYPELVDEKIAGTFAHAQRLAGISTSLDGVGIDVDESVGRLLTPEQHQVLGSVVYKTQRRILNEVRGRHRQRARK